ncbi:protein O-linked-mannose beta-1,2-N-acetylglucosaminyltransferase 1 [Lingula anatina]|uniref:Protein O-linked-mannose beta-1,2-N-acetylglucosaminyltransferase 1 n=1 Tax=Lingula anatina TaxID=7574 RepID=A0A1S3ICP5_LINAN|nr:protein O-linked-mannose beta-1,2-N-acetylglucosaminyltransferase 1 [Lingula anatina]|eukprot:XP_013395204.1 protein O-linked-mannose beta-1,2-N-acetylglucosaminyltransferase 1 [Lingula anatina]
MFSLRRAIIRNFGGWKYFIMWILALSVAIYLIDSYLMPSRPVSKLLKDASATPGTVHVLKTGAAPLQSVPTAVLKVDKPKEGPKSTPAPKARQPEEPAKLEHHDNAPKKELKLVSKCHLRTPCEAGKFSFYIGSGHGKEDSGEQPVICIEDNFVINRENKKGKRGLTVVVVDNKTGKVLEDKVFDTYSDDAPLVRFLKYDVPDDAFILVASYDDASTRLKDESRFLLKKYGSQHIDKLSFRDSFAMLGQKGLETGKAVEKVVNRGGGEDFAKVAEVGGCFTSPMGTISKLEFKKPYFLNNGTIQVAEEVENCGLEKACPEDHIAIHAYTGYQNKVGPKICVNGKYIVYPGYNDNGRGFNLVAINPKTKDAYRVGHFDTYAEDSSTLEIFLEMMKDDDILVAVTFDDASTNLKLLAKKILQEMGSSLVDTLGLRDAYFFIGQKSISGGKSEHEQVSYVTPPSEWPTPIEKKLCIPKKLEGKTIKIDPVARRNDKRREFCKKYEGYGDFCEGNRLDEALTPAPLSDKALEGSAIFKVPIVIVPGLSPVSLRKLLDTVLMQPGLNPQYVVVMCDEKFPEQEALGALYGFKVQRLSSSTKYAEQIGKALERQEGLYDVNKYIILLEEDLLLSADFLSFMAQLLPVLEKDQSLSGVSAWNDNGFKEVGGDAQTVMREETFPGRGSLIRKSFYQTHMKGKMKDCCIKGTWHGWLAQLWGDSEMLVPEVSRVFRQQYEGSAEDAELMQALFNKPRLTNLDANVKVKGHEALTKDQYEQLLQNLIKTAEFVEGSTVTDCLNAKSDSVKLPDTSKGSYVLVYHQSSATDYQTLQVLAKCFHLFWYPKASPRGLHKGVLRFSNKGKPVLLVGSEGPYRSLIPTTYKLIKAP